MSPNIQKKPYIQGMIWASQAQNTAKYKCGYEEYELKNIYNTGPEVVQNYGACQFCNSFKLGSR